ncbi:MAG: PAS domain S-box protein [Bacteroidota bacterium]
MSESKLAERNLAKHLEEQRTLFELTNSLFRANGADAVFDAALDAILQALCCQRASILLCDDSGAMKFVAWRRLSEGYRQAVEGHSPWTPNTEDPQPICIEDVSCARLEDWLEATIRIEGIFATAFIPLVAKGELIGKLAAYYDNPHVFSDAEIDLAITIARQLVFGLQRMRAEKERALAEQESRLLTAIVEASHDAIISKDLNGIITSWNLGAEQLFGYSPEEVIGKSITILIPLERRNEEIEILGRIRRGERVEHFETVRLRKDGTRIDISLRISPVLDATGKVVGASKIARDITEKKQAQARQELLTSEIHHRTKNLLAVVQAVVSRSFENKQTVAEAKDAILSRLQALAQTHDLLIDRNWKAADMAQVVRMEMSAYADRVTIDGPSISLNARAAQNFALALHELATNAAKYGALSNSTGRVQITWSVQRESGSSQFAFRWQEIGGPRVVASTRKGFGSTVLVYVMREYFDPPPQIAFEPGGVVYELRGALDAIAVEDPPKSGTPKTAGYNS